MLQRFEKNNMLRIKDSDLKNYTYMYDNYIKKEKKTSIWKKGGGVFVHAACNFCLKK